MATKRNADHISDQDDSEPVKTEVQVAKETPPEDVFIPPSIIRSSLFGGASYTHHSSIPPNIMQDLSQPCVMGIDEAGRGPVLGPMVYGLAYLPMQEHRSLLADTYHFDDSKVLTPEVRSSLLEQWCTPGTSLYMATGWAVRLLSARDISAGMLRPKHVSGYNLNQQAMDATVTLIQETINRGINIAEIYVDTIGKPEIYQKKLERIFPNVKITVTAKADSLFPCVSAASVAAKVTRDAALEVLWQEFHASETIDLPNTDSSSALPNKKSKTGKRQRQSKKEASESHASQGWGSGYPSDARCKGWLRSSMHSVFGWGPEFRFSWGGAGREFLEEKNEVKVEWPEPDDEDGDSRISKFFVGGPDGNNDQHTAKVDDTDELLQDHWKSLSDWYGTAQPVAA